MFDLLASPSWPAAAADVAAKSAALLAVAWPVTLMLRKRSAAARHLVWTLALVSLLALPPLSLMLPAWRVLPSWAAAPSVAANAAEAPVVAPAPNMSPVAPVMPVMIASPRPSPFAAVPSVDMIGTPAVDVPAPAPQPSAPLWSRLSLPAVLALLWAIGVVLSLLPVLAGLAALWRMSRAARRLTDGPWADSLAAAASRLGVTRPVTLLEGRPKSMPTVWGLLRPKLLVPAHDELWTPERRAIVLLHELAHVKRRDCLTRLLGRLVCAVYWANPLAWLALRRLQAESERACDDLVISTGNSPADYAGHILAIVSSVSESRIVNQAAIAMARRSGLEGRLVSILDEKRSRGGLTRIGILAAAVLVAGIAVPVSVLKGAGPGTPALQAASAWAGERGWKAAEIKEATIKYRWGGWQNLPFDISQGEEADVKACVKLAGRTYAAVNGMNEFNREDTRTALEAILKARPDYFYPEFLLGVWHRNHGNAEESKRYFEASYKHAPVIIAQRYEFENGKPLANEPIQHLALECNRVKKGSLDPSLELSYPNLRTDNEGCIYLPVYDTVFRRAAASFPEDFTADYPTLGWFRTTRRVGLLPVCVVMPNSAAATKTETAAEPAPADSAFAATLPSGVKVEIVGVSYRPSTGRKWWRPDGTELAEPPYAYLSPGTWRSGYDVRELALRLTGDGVVIPSLTSTSQEAGAYAVASEGGEPVEVMIAQYLFLKPGERRGSLRLGVAARPWTIVGTSTSASSGAIPSPSGTIFYEAVETAGGSAVIVAVRGTPKDRDYRVVAIDSTGDAIPGRPSGRVTDGDMIQMRDHFPGLRLRDIKEFQYQTRPYEWVEFKDIALEPGPGAAVSSVASPRLADVMDGLAPNPFDGLTPENLSERLRPFIEEAERAGTDAERARDYVWLAQIVDGRTIDPASQHVVTELADKALSYKLSPTDKADMLARKGSAIRKQGGFWFDTVTPKARREVMTLWAEAYKVEATYKNELEEAFKRDHPHFNPKATLNDFLQSTDALVVDSGAHLITRDSGPDRIIGRSPAMTERSKQVREYRLIEGLKRGLGRREGVFVELYTLRPYDNDELRELVTKIIGDAALADDLVARTQKEIAKRQSQEQGAPKQPEAASQAQSSSAKAPAAQSTDTVATPEPPAPLCTGTILDSSGVPVAGAAVTVYEVRQRDIPITLRPLADGATAADGAFSLPLPSDQLEHEAFVVVSKDGFALGWADIDLTRIEKADITLDRPVSISGTVVNESGAPIAGATLTAILMRPGAKDPQYVIGLPPLDALRLTTDGGGRFSLAAVPPAATAEFLVTAPGKADTPTWGDRVPSTLQFAAGRADVKIVLPAEAVIEGTVVDKATGNAVPGVALTATLVNAQASPFSRSGATSGPDGAFRITGLNSGEWRLSLVSRPGVMPGGVSEGISVKVESGKTASGVKLEVGKGGIVEIAVKSSEGKPIEGVSGSLRSQINNVVSFVTDAQGAAKLRLLPGTYIITGPLVVKAGYWENLHSESVVVANGETARLDIAMTGGHRSQGVAIDASGALVAGATVRVMPGGFNKAVTTGADGAFDITWTDSVLDGRKEESVMVLRHAARNLAWVGPVDDSAAPLRITLAPAATITGRVVDGDGKAFEGASVYAEFWTEDWGSSLSAPVRTDAEGRYRLLAVPWGYRIDVVASAEGFGRRTLKMSLAEGGATEVTAKDLKLTPANLTLSGTVVDPDGKPVSGADVSVSGEEQPHQQPFKTDENGRFAFTKLAEGTVKLYAFAPNYSADTKVKAGDKDVRLVLRARSSESPAPAASAAPAPVSLLGVPLPDTSAFAITPSLDGTGGKPLLICFIDADSRPSRQLVKDLASRAADLKAKGIIVALVNTASTGAEPARKLASDSGLSCPVGAIAKDPDSVLHSWGAAGIPWLVLTDGRHVVTRTGSGIADIGLDSTAPAAKPDAAGAKKTSEGFGATGSLVQHPEDPTKWQVRASVDERNIVRVKMGQRVYITLPAFPGRTFEGKVLNTARYPVPAPNEVSYQVSIQVDDPDPGFLLGVTALVWFSLKDASANPAAAQPTASASAVQSTDAASVVPAPTPVARTGNVTDSSGAPQPRPASLDEAAERLRQSVDGDWRLEENRLTGGFTTWYNLNMPYQVVPYPYGPGEEEREEVRRFINRGSVPFEIIASDDRFTLAGTTVSEPDVTEKILATLGMTERADFEKARLAEAMHHGLGFRLAVARPSDRKGDKPLPLSNGPTMPQIEDYTRYLAERGPNGGRQRGDAYQWFCMLKYCRPSPLLVRADEPRGAGYLLLSNKPEEIVVSGGTHPQEWYLRRVYAARDRQGRDAVALELDDSAAARLGELTRTHIGCPLAILFDDYVLDVWTIDAETSDRVVISGEWMTPELAGKIVRSLAHLTNQGQI